MLSVLLALALTLNISLRGTILDATGAPIQGAYVVAVPDGGGPGPSTVTDARGAFTLSLAPGPYTITAVAPGFVESSRRVSAAQTDATVPPLVLQVAGF